MGKSLALGGGRGNAETKAGMNEGRRSRGKSHPKLSLCEGKLVPLGEKRQ